MNIRSYIKAFKLFGFAGANNVRFSLNKCLLIIYNLWICNHENDVQSCLDYVFTPSDRICYGPEFILNYVVWMTNKDNELAYFNKPATFHLQSVLKIKKICVNSVMCSILSKAFQMGLINKDELTSFLEQFEFKNETPEEKEVRTKYIPSHYDGWAVWNTNGSGWVSFISTPM